MTERRPSNSRLLSQRRTGHLAPHLAAHRMLVLQSDAQLSVLVLDENAARAAIIEAGLREANFQRVTVLTTSLGLIEQVYRIDPDVILIDLENPSRDMLEQMFQVSRVAKRPIAMFVDQSDKRTIEEAIEAGVSAYVVDGLKKERVQSVLEMAMARFNAFEKMETELRAAKSALEDRKVIERAKGILMQKRGISEDDAYAHLRRTAMRQNKKLVDVAASLISAADLLD